jgi:NitT/TauT family transport system permease protein
VLGLPPATTALTVMAPAALPEIIAGIRVGAALTLLGTLIGELFASTSGLGFALMRAMDIHAVTDILALTLILFTFAACLNAYLRLIERRTRHGG